MKNYWRNLKDEFFVNYVLDEVKKSYIGAGDFGFGFVAGAIGIKIKK